jgi:tRNA G18 (ribose-2'-O)-methylase SpoU
MTGVETRQHSSVKRFRQIARTSTANGLDRELLLDGVHLLAEALSSGMRIDIAAFEHAILEQPDARSVAERLTAAGCEVLIVSRNVLEAMSPVKTPSGVVGIARRPAERLEVDCSPPLVSAVHSFAAAANLLRYEASIIRPTAR